MDTYTQSRFLAQAAVQAHALRRVVRAHAEHLLEADDRGDTTPERLALAERLARVAIESAEAEDRFERMTYAAKQREEATRG